jgi:hypothetical protein
MFCANGALCCIYVRFALSEHYDAFAHVIFSHLHYDACVLCILIQPYCAQAPVALPSRFFLDSNKALLAPAPSTEIPVCMQHRSQETRSNVLASKKNRWQ